MAINFSDSYVKTYLDYIDEKAISFFEDKKSIGVNNLIDLKDEENNYLSYLKYAYIYIGALYHNIIYSAHYETLANAEPPTDAVKLFRYDWASGDAVADRLYSGKRSGGYYIYDNCIYPCYFFFDDIEENSSHIYFEKIYCISPHFRILIERERREGDPADPAYQQFEKSADATKELFKKNQDGSSQDHTIKIKVTNLKNINESFENDINFDNNTLPVSSINIGFNVSTEANNGSNNIEIMKSDLENLSILINKILYVWNAGSYRGGVYNVNSMDGQTKYTTPSAFPRFSYLRDSESEINPEIIITISNFIDTDGYLENVKLLQASYEQLIHTFKGINSAKNFFDYFEDNYDTYESPQDVDSTMGVADIYDLWLNDKNKSGDAIAPATLIGNLKAMLEQHRFNTTFVKEVGSTITPIEWDWDDLTFIDNLDFSLSENKQALKNLFFITTLYQFYSQIYSSDELLNDETIKCGVASESKASSLLTEKEYEEKLCRSTLTRLYNDSTPVDGTKKNIQFLYIDRQEGFGNNNDMKLLETEYADAIIPYNGIDPYFNGKIKNSMGRQTSGNMSHCCAVNIGGTIRFYYDFYYKTRFHDKPIEGSTVEPYAPKTKKSPHLHAVSTSATCPYAILDDTVGSSNNDTFLVMREVDSAQLDPSNFCIVFIHGSHTGGLRLEKAQDQDVMTDLEYRYRNAMYGPDPLCCLPNPFYEDSEFEFYINFERDYDTIQGSDFYEKLINYCGDTSVDILVYTNGMSPEHDTPVPIDDITDIDQRAKLQSYITQQIDYLKSLNNMYVELSENDGAMCPEIKAYMEQKMPNIIINNTRYFLPVTVGVTYEQISITVITAQGDLAERIYVKKYLDDGKTNEVPSGNSGVEGSYPIGKWVVIYDQVTEDGKDIDSLREGYIFDKEQPTPENVGLQLLEVFKSGAHHQGGDNRVLNDTNDPIYPEDDDYAALYQKYAKWGWGTLNEVFGNSRDYSQQST